MKITLLLFILPLLGLSSFSSVACCEFNAYNFTGPSDIGSCSNVIYFEVFMIDDETPRNLRVSRDGVSIYSCYNYRCNYTSETSKYPHSYSVTTDVRRDMAQDKIGGPDVYLYGEPYIQKTDKVLTEGDGILIMLLGIIIGFGLTWGCISIVVLALIPDPFASWKKKHLSKLKDIAKGLDTTNGVISSTEAPADNGISANV